MSTIHTKKQKRKDFRKVKEAIGILWTNADYWQKKNPNFCNEIADDLYMLMPYYEFRIKGEFEYKEEVSG